MASCTMWSSPRSRTSRIRSKPPNPTDLPPGGAALLWRRRLPFRNETVLTILFDGVAYGMLLFILACGLAVTLGLMNFVNLAHGAFAMTGGYICAVLVNNSGWPFFAALPLAFVSAAAIGVALERTLYRHLYTRSHLDQVLFTIGLTFMSVAAVDYI